MKKILLVLMLVITSVGVSGCGTKQAQTTESQTAEQSELGLEKTETLVHDDSEYVVYVHQTGCPHCAKVSPVVRDFSESHPNIKVYDMNISDFNFFSKPFSNSTNEAPQLPTPVTDDILISSVPTVFYVKDGQIEKIGVGDGGPNGASAVLLSIK